MRLHATHIKFQIMFTKIALISLFLSQSTLTTVSNGVLPVSSSR